MTDTHKKALATVPSEALPERMSPIVSAGMAILQANPDPATLRELLAVQREWEAGEARRLFNVALHALKADLPPSIAKRHVVKDRSGAAMYRHATLADIMDAVTGPLERHGFTVTWSPSCDGGDVSVRCQLHHIGGHVEATTMTAPADKGQNRNAVQAIGSTQTYLQRYTLCALLGLAATDADDADKRDSSPDAVNQAANQRALAWLMKRGWSESRCAKVVGRPRDEWTAADLAALNAAWKASQTPSQPDREPGEDDDIDPAG